MIEKNPSKAVALFWSALNSGDRMESALKDMVAAMKQLGRSYEAIEAIKSFRHCCASDSQDSLDNMLLELYKNSRKQKEQIEFLQLKLKRIELGNNLGARNKKLKQARRVGKKVHLTVEQEYARILGNLAWVYLERNDYRTAEKYYRKALSIEHDRNNQCNLTIFLMHTNRKPQAKILLDAVHASCPKGWSRMGEPYSKSLKQAFKLLADIESQPSYKKGKSYTNDCHKKPNKSIANKSRRVKVGCSVGKSNVWRRKYTASVDEVQGIPDSPISQPNSPIVLYPHNDGSETEQYCNAICLMGTNKIEEAKTLLNVVGASSPKGQMDKYNGKSFEQASELFPEIERQSGESLFMPDNHNCPLVLSAYSDVPEAEADAEPEQYGNVLQSNADESQQHGCVSDIASVNKNMATPVSMVLALGKTIT
ncbi:Protein POLLENLESS 3, partial [Bienertia sinuspersici]